MSVQARHAVLPETTHDEAARQDFVKSMRQHVTMTLTPGNEVVYRRSVLPAFTRAHGRAPKDRGEVHTAMLRAPYHQAWSAMMRTTQEMMWESIGASVDRQLPALAAKAAPRGKTKGSLTLDPALKLPRYVTAVDIHCMPGNYTGDLGPGDVAAGALYDRGVYLYMMGGMGGHNQSCGDMLHGYVRKTFPDFRPRRILDMGCAVGHSTLPWVEEFPAAEVHGIDVGAAMLRYAHARAEALGQPVHFSQQNAERTNFADASFDLVVSHIALHETSTQATKNILRESRRLLRPGGMALHLEVPPFAGKDPFDQYLTDWDTHYNAEPFIGTLHDLDLRREIEAAGFGSNEVILDLVPLVVYTADPGRDGNYAHHVGGHFCVSGGRRGA
jgi:SAM-dependent methyltransferase